MADKVLTDSEKLDILARKIRRLEFSTHIQTAIIVIGFLGIVNMATLISKLKNNFK